MYRMYVNKVNTPHLLLYEVVCGLMAQHDLAQRGRHHVSLQNVNGCVALK